MGTKRINFSVPLFRLICSLTALCLLMQNRVWGLDPTHEISQYNCETWTRQNGLPVNSIHSIAQTKEGHIWLGTAAGLVRFDGLEFKLFDFGYVSHLNNSFVTSIAPGQHGGLWVGLQNSSFGFFDNSKFTLRAQKNWGGFEMKVCSIFENTDGTLWVTAQRQGSRISKDGSYEEVWGSSTNNDVYIICSYQDPSGRVWFGGAHGVSFWEAGKTTAFPDPSLQDVSVHAIIQDVDGNIWMGTPDGLRCYDPQFKRKEIPHMPHEVHALFVDRHGVMWIGTTGGGLARYRDGQYTFLRKSDGLASAYVNAITEDLEGSLWVATRDGLSQLSDLKFATYNAAENPAITDAWCVSSSPHGGIWIGSSGGVSYYDGKIKTYSAGAGLPSGPIRRTFEASNGDLYVIGGRSSTRLMIMRKGKIIATHTTTEMFVGMTEDSEGVIVSKAGLLYRVNTESLTPFTYLNGKPDMNWILNLQVGKDGSLWVASENGIYQIKDGRFKNWSGPGELAATRIQNLHVDDDGTVWGALLTGIVRLKDDKVRFINRDNGLFENNTFAIVPDDAGNFWVDSGRGIFRVSRQSLNDFADGKTPQIECTPFDGKNSVRTTDKTYQECVSAKTPDGRIWFPTPNGVVVIDPAHLLVNPVPPPVHIDRIVANGFAFEDVEDIVVPPGKGEVEFRFAALSFVSPRGIKVRYQLVGYDKYWVEAGDRRMAFYTNLRPGRYQFQVTAANADGVWNNVGDTRSIEFRPHFQQTIWFYLLCGGAFCGVLGGIYYLRIRHMNRKQQSLQRIREELEVQVRNRTAELAVINTSLNEEIGHHKVTEQELQERSNSLEKEIDERKRMQAEVERIHRELLTTSRQAGMAEVATGVLHNVGNVLNSVNVSATLVADHVRRSKGGNLSKVCVMLDQNKANVGEFINNNPKGQIIPAYLSTLADDLTKERETVTGELDNLRKNIEHIREIVAMQQSFAKTSGFNETISLPDVIEDAVRLNTGSLERHGVRMVRDYQSRPVMTLDKHKVIQILVNLVRNAKYACDESGRIEKIITMRITSSDQRVQISVIDNGVGIPAENLTRIFNHGFTTRKEGHGFGLHSGALAARELGGSLTVASAGVGQGASFILDLPFAPQNQAKEKARS